MSDVLAASDAGAPEVPGYLAVAAAALAAFDDPVVLLASTEPHDWRIVWVNDAWERTTGWSRREVTGESPTQLIGPLSEPDIVEQTEAMSRATGSVVRRSVVFHARDGAALLCDLRAGILAREPDGPEWAWAQLHIEDDRYRTLLENISDAVVVLDRDGIVRYASPSVGILGHDHTAIVGTSVFELLDPTLDGTDTATLFRRVLAEPGTHGPWTLAVKGGDGAARPVEVVVNNRLDDPSVHGVVVTARAADERVATEAALASSERRFRALVRHAYDIVLLVEVDGTLRYASPAIEELLGFRLEGDNIEGSGLLESVHPDDLEPLRERVRSSLGAAGAVEPIEVRVRDATGDWRVVEIRANNLLDDPDVAGVVVNGRDITERRDSDRLLAAELSVLDCMAASETMLPVLRRIAEVVEGFVPGSLCSVGALDDDGVVRHPSAASLPPALVAALDAEAPDGDLGRVLRSSADWLVTDDVTCDRRWSGIGAVAAEHGLRACWCIAVRGADDAVLGTVAVFLDTARGPHPAERPLLERLRHLASLALDRNRFERRLRDQAVHDALTGLPNRTLLVDRVTQALESGERRGARTAVLFVDLDRFKVVNDSLGHAKGDELLRQVAARLSAAMRKGDTVGRFGGDEFLVIAEDVAGEAGAVFAAERLLATLSQPFDVDGAQLVVTASIGVALAGPGADPVTADALVRNADAAMYRAKDSGRSRVAVFEDTLHAELVRRYEVEQGLRCAVERGELVVLYQPRVRLADGRLSGVEALVRWDRPGDGRIGADELVPIAEETGLIVSIGATVLATACEQAVAWDRDPALAGLCVSVNLSARQLNDPNVVDVVAGTLRGTGLDAARLCLEVTESALARDPGGAATVLASLKRLGVRVAIDDFGTGYATLDYVRRFSMADELKIDRSFVAGIGDARSPDAAIVSAAIVLADALGFETVAEGVETTEQVAVLRRLGCVSAQGWYFGRPLGAGAIRDHVNQVGAGAGDAV